MLDTISKPALDQGRNIQLQLNRLNALRLNPTLPTLDWEDEILENSRLAVVEGKFSGEEPTSGGRPSSGGAVDS